MSSRNHQNALFGKHKTGVCCLVILFILLAHSVWAQQTIGYVVNARGQWFLNSSQKINAGSPLPAGGKISAQNPSSGDFIEIADRSGQRIIISRSCRQVNCSQPITLPREESGIVSRVFEAAVTFFSGDPARFIVLISRGAGGLKEAVVKLVGEEVDLSPLMANKGSGKYLLRLVPKSDAAVAAKKPPIDRITVNWDTNKFAIVSIKGITPGLYEAQLLNSEDMEPLEPGTEAWVLITKQENFDQAFCSFKEVTDITNKWGESARDDTKIQLLRSTLGYLDSQLR
jgi:hypothetical protein